MQEITFEKAHQKANIDPINTNLKSLDSITNGLNVLRGNTE